MKNINLEYLQSFAPKDKKIIYLHYVHDPMCSWCWCFVPIMDKLTNLIKDFNNKSSDKFIQVNYLCGGLARDSDEPMPKEMQQQLQSYWSHIQSLYNTEFNFDFWSKNEPKRATYMSNRAVLTAFKLNKSNNFASQKAMIKAIQIAYYKRALNPSVVDVLVNLASELDYDKVEFKRVLLSQEIDNILKQNIKYSRVIGGNSFPSIIIENNNNFQTLPNNYKNANAIFKNINI